MRLGVKISESTVYGPGVVVGTSARLTLFSLFRDIGHLKIKPIFFVGLSKKFPKAFATPIVDFAHPHTFSQGIMHWFGFLFLT